MKKILLASLLMAATSANATTKGPYLGLGLGASGKNVRQLGEFAGRVSGGYQLNQYVGFEGGLSRYSYVKYFNMNAIDAVGKAYLPASQNVNFYALAGVADVHSKVKKKKYYAARSSHRVRPKLGLGVSYNLTKQLTMGVEASRVQGVGNVKTNRRAIPNADMILLNFTYNFG